jgi:ketosteroid isomerase-like protein
LQLVSALMAASTLSVPLAYTQTAPLVSSTWFGSIVIHGEDGKISHDNAVLVLENAGSKVHGSMGRTIDQMTPWAGGSLVNGSLTFRLDAAGGLNVSLSMAREHLVGTAIGSGMSATVDLKPAPGLMPHAQLQQEIAAVDQRLYESFGNCDVVGYASFLSTDLEFYQDRTGKTDYEQNVKALQDRCAEGIRMRRELNADSLVVNAAPGFGAIQAGTQRFYSRNKDGLEHLDATAQFTNVWSKQSGTWKLVRVISYDHH